MGFWNKTDQSQTEQIKVQQAAKQGLGTFITAINASSEARRGFWSYVLDREDFMQWPMACKQALFKKAWFDGFLTITQYPQAIALTFAATSLSLFALSLVTSASLTLFACVMVTGLICAASYVMDHCQTNTPLAEDVYSPAY